MSDEIIEELWLVKDEIAREHGYDVESLAAYFQGKERTGERQVVDLQSMRKVAEQGKSPTPSSSGASGPKGSS